MSNKRYKTLDNSTAGDVEQFNSFRIKKDLVYKTPPSLTISKPFDIWYKNKNIDSRAVSNTFQYLFHNMKKGIFVRIANNKLETWLPFVNMQYRNSFHPYIVENDIEIKKLIDLSSQLAGYKKSNQKIKPINEWVANNALLRYDYEEKDNNIVILKNMFETCCNQREMPDVEFFVNRRDFPQMKRDGTEAYTDIFGNTKLAIDYDKYSPIFSCSTSIEYADILFPTYEDWARAKYQQDETIFPNMFRKYPIPDVKWEDKKSLAVFRGSSTGVGITKETNQRLNAVYIAKSYPDILDIGITKWNTRIRKLRHEKRLQILKPTALRVPPLTLQQQAKYKYILSLEGNVFAYRLSYELCSGSVVLLADTKWDIWYKHLLVPMVHYVPVRHDLSNLVQQVQWCVQHDTECKEIVNNARLFYNKYLTVDGILDFLQNQLWHCSSETGVYKYFPNLPQLYASEEAPIFSYTPPLEYKYPRPTVRCIGNLQGFHQVFQTKQFHNLDFKQTIFKNVNGRVDLFTTNQTFIVGKIATNKDKIMEHVHEAFIGTRVVNDVVARIPNFSYTFGTLKDVPNMVFNEYVQGVTMHEWLSSAEYNEKQFVEILLQINLALLTAQALKNFIHYDLYPWNIILQFQQTPIEIYYPIFNEKIKILSYVIPRIIDYGKSSGLVYGVNGLINHGFVNLFRGNRILDTLTLLLSSLNILKKRNDVNLNFISNLTTFAVQLNPKLYDISYYSKYGMLFEFNFLYATPKNFIDFLVARYPNNMFTTVTFNWIMEKGNAIYSKHYMLTGDENKSILEFLKHVDQQRIPHLDQEIYPIILAQINRITKHFIGTLPLSYQGIWAQLYKQLFVYKPKSGTLFNWTIPVVNNIALDENVSPEYVARLCATNEPSQEKIDWQAVKNIIYEAHLFGVKIPDEMSFFINDTFWYFDSMSKLDTIHFLNKKISK